MANLNDGSSDWPTTKDVYIAETDDPKTAKTRVRASIPNGVYKWIENAQNDLGGSLAGSKADAKTRLEVRHAGDGTDLDKIRILGANSLTTLQATIDDLPSGGGEVYLPTGEETLTAYAEIESNQMLKGSGAASVIKGTEGGHKVLNQDQSADMVSASVKDLTIDGDSDSGASANREQYHGIDLSNTTYLADDNILGPTLWIKNVGGDGICFRNANRNIVQGVIIDLNWQDIGANLCGRNGIASLDGDTLIIANVIIRRGATSGIDLEPALATELINRVVIQNCILEDNLNGITINSTVGGLGDVEHVSINNCTIRVGDNSATGFDTGTSGIALKYARNVNISNCVILGQSDLTKSGTGIYIQYSDHICIDNCIINGCLDGIKIDNVATAPTNDLQISNCKINGSYHGGIYAVNGSGNAGDRLTISNTHVKNSSQVGAGTWQGIITRYFNYVNINNCQAYDDQGTHTQKTGVHVEDATAAVVIGNLADGNTHSQLRLISAGITNLEYGHNVGVVTFV